MTVEICDRVACSFLGSLLLLAVLGSLTWQEHKVAWTAVRVQLTAPAARKGAAEIPQDAWANGSAERFEAALAAWLPGHTAALALMDDVAAGRKPQKALKDVRVVILYICQNGLGNRLPGLVTGATRVAFLTCVLIQISNEPRPRCVSGLKL